MLSFATTSRNQIYDDHQRNQNLSIKNMKIFLWIFKFRLEREEFIYLSRVIILSYVQANPINIIN